LHYTAFPWFKYIEDFNKENTALNGSLELTKNSTGTSITDAKNTQKIKWCHTIQQVRIAILQY
jgi:hypothetical protein